MYWRLAPICNRHPSVPIGPAIILTGIGIAYPAMYVYAIYRLLKFVKDKEGGEDGRKANSPDAQHGSV
jgi:hypothetical protein